MIAALLPTFESPSASRPWSPWPWIAAFSLAWAVAMAALGSFPPRFALAGGAGLCALTGACFVNDKRRYFLALMTLALFVGINKTVFKTPGSPQDNPDRLIVSLLDGLLTISYLIWAFSAMRSQERGVAPARTLLAPIALLFLTVAPSFAGTKYPVFGFLEMIRMLRGLVLYWFLIHNIRSRKDLRWVLGWLAFAVILELGVVLVQKYGLHGNLGRGMVYLGEGERKMESMVGSETIFRAGGTLGHPNAMAYCMDLIVPLMLSLSFCAALSSRLRLLFTAAFLAGWACLYFSMSRGGLVGTGLGSLLAFVFIAAGNIRHRRQLGKTLLMAAAGLLLAGVIAKPIYKRFAKNDAGAFKVRLYQWRVARNMIAEHPWTGVGLNTFTSVGPAYDDTPVRITRVFRFPVHNVYLIAFSETGLLGLAGLLLFILAALRMANPLPWAYGEHRDLHVGFFFSILAYATHGNVDINPPVSYLFFYFMLGLLTVAHSLGRREAA